MEPEGDDVAEPGGFRAKWRKRKTDCVDQSHDAELETDLDRFLKNLGAPLPSEYAPTTPAEDKDDDVIIDVGGVTSCADDDALVSDTFIRGTKHTGFKMPWETPLMSQILEIQVQLQPWPCPSIGVRQISRITPPLMTLCLALRSQPHASGHVQDISNILQMKTSLCSVTEQ